MKHHHSHVKSTLSIWMCVQLVWNSFSPSAAYARSGPSRFVVKRSACEEVLALVEKQQALLGSPTLSTGQMETKTVALLRSLPPALFKNYRDTIFTYLLLNSPRSDKLDILTKARAQLLPREANLAKDVILQNSINKKPDKATEFALRMHPALHELQRLFEFPGAEADFGRSKTDVNQIIRALENREPFEQQIAIRSAMEQIAASGSANYSYYSYTILLQAATQLATGSSVDKASKGMARDLGLLIPPDNIFFQTEISKNQLSLIAMSNLENNKLKRVQVRLALKALFYHPDWEFKWGAFWTNALAGFSIGGIYLIFWANSSDWTPASFYTLPSEMLSAWIMAMGVNFVLKYLAVLKVGPHPVVDEDNHTAIRYLERETKERAQLLLDRLNSEITFVRDQLAARTPQPTPSPAPQPTPAPPPPLAPPVPQVVAQPPATPADGKTVSVGGVAAASAKKPAPPPEPVKPKVTGNEVRAKLEGFISSRKSSAPKIILADDVKLRGGRFATYFGEVASRVVERDRFIDHIATGLLMGSVANILIAGEPGVAKSATPKLILPGITDENGNSSFFKIQVGKNTTIDDLLGSVKTSLMRKEDRVLRASEKALPGAQLGFIDEYFRAPVYTREDLLGLQADGEVMSSGETYFSKARLIVYASNTYPNGVFKLAGDDSPRAEMDRMLFVHIFAPIFEKDEHMIELRKIDRGNLPKIYFSDIDALIGVANQVPIDRYYRTKIKLLVNKLREETLSEEYKSVLQYHRRILDGEVVLVPPDHSYRVLSPRSEAIAQTLLSRFATGKWIKEGMPSDHLPTITAEEFGRLDEFFLANSSSDEHLRRVLRQYPDGSLPNAEFGRIISNRARYVRILGDIEKGVDESSLISGLRRTIIQLGLPWEKLANGQPLDGIRVHVSDDNAVIVNDFLSWYERLSKDLANRPEIEETTVDDLAQDEAKYVADRLLGVLAP